MSKFSVLFLTFGFSISAQALTPVEAKALADNFEGDSLVQQAVRTEVDLESPDNQIYRVLYVNMDQCEMKVIIEKGIIDRYSSNRDYECDLQ